MPARVSAENDRNFCSGRTVSQANSDDTSANISSEFKDILASRLSTLMRDLLQEHEVFVRKRDELFTHEIDALRSNKAGETTRGADSVYAGSLSTDGVPDERKTAVIKMDANDDSASEFRSESKCWTHGNSKETFSIVKDVAVLSPSFSGAVLSPSFSSELETGTHPVETKARNSGSQGSSTSSTSPKKKGRFSLWGDSNGPTSSTFFEALDPYIAEDHEFGEGLMGQNPTSAIEDLFNELPNSVLRSIEVAMQEPDPKLGLRHFFFNISRHLMIQLIMDVVVIANVLTLGVQADLEWDGWFYVDVAFAIFFTVELVMNLRKFGCSGFFLSPNWRWHVLDLFLVVLSVMEVALDSMTRFFQSSADNDGADDLLPLRSARLVRLARILRLLRLDIFRDLLLMVNGAIGGVRTLFWSILLITVPVYAFALFFTETVGQKAGMATEFDVAEHFGTVPRSMFTGFRCLVIGDCTSMNGTPIFPHLVSNHGWVYGFVYVLTSICMSFGLFNVIVAIYVENTVAAAKENELLQRHRRLMDQAAFAENMLLMARFLWSELNGGVDEVEFRLQEAFQLKMTRGFFESVQDHPRFQFYLDNLDVPREDHLDLFDICDCDGSGLLSFEELVAGVKRLRGEPRRSDLVFVMLRVREMMGEVQLLRSDMNVVRRMTTGATGQTSPTFTHTGSERTTKHLRIGTGHRHSGKTPSTFQSI